MLLNLLAVGDVVGEGCTQSHEYEKVVSFHASATYMQPHAEKRMRRDVQQGKERYNSIINPDKRKM